MEGAPHPVEKGNGVPFALNEGGAPLVESQGVNSLLLSTGGGAPLGVRDVGFSFALKGGGSPTAYNNERVHPPPAEGYLSSFS